MRCLGESPGDFRVVNGSSEGLEPTNALLLLLFLFFAVFLDLLLIVFLFFIDRKLSYLLLHLLLLSFFAVLLVEVVYFLDGIEFTQNFLGNIVCVFQPKRIVFLRVGSKMTIKVILPHTIAITFCLLSFHLKKHLILLIPLVDVDIAVATKMDEFGNLELVIFGGKTVGYYVGSERDQLDSLEFVTYIPCYVVDTELQSFGCIQQQKNSHSLKFLIDIHDLLYQFDYFI